jgi:hypothetical protein
LNRKIGKIRKGVGEERGEEKQEDQKIRRVCILEPF